jgi:acetoin utilization protein AcuB
MFVRDRMTTPPISVHPESDPLAALGLCKSARIRRLPVVDADKRVVGIVTRHMLEQFLAKAPSPGVIKRQHTIQQVMVDAVIMVSPEYPLEEAARLMVVHKIGSLPVVENDRLVGIITETDIFRQFVEILGGQSAALRLTVQVPDTPGSLAKVVNAVAALRGNIHSVVLTPCTDCDERSATLWVEDIDDTALTAAIQNIPDVQLVRIWHTPSNA